MISFFALWIVAFDIAALFAMISFAAFGFWEEDILESNMH